MSARQPIIEIFQGLPASGKTTMARQRVEATGGKTVRVSKDDLRAMLSNGKYDAFTEELVLAVRDAAIVNAVAANYDVIVDDTNIEPKHIARIRGLLGSSAEVIVTVFDTPLEECVKRNYARTEGQVPETAIRRMARRWEEVRRAEDR